MRQAVEFVIPHILERSPWRMSAQGDADISLVQIHGNCQFGDGTMKEVRNICVVLHKMSAAPRGHRYILPCFLFFKGRSLRRTMT